MSLATLLSDYQRRDRQAGSFIQKLERRIKILEEQNDPTSILEPSYDLDFITGGRVINTCEITSLGAAGGGEGSGIARKDLGDGGGDATCIAKFAKSVSKIDGVHVTFRSGGLPTFQADLEDSDDYALSQITLKVAFITEDFDIDTVAEGVSSTGEQEIDFTCTVVGGALALQASGSGNLDMSIRQDGIGLRFEAVHAGPYYGLKITMGGNAGILSNAFVECDVDIDMLAEDDPTNPLGLSASSTYVTTIS